MMDSFSQQTVLQEVTGGAAFSNVGVLTPAMFGNTTLQLTHNRVIERTKRIISRRYCEIQLHRVDSAEIVEEGVIALLILGFPLLALFFVGIIFIILYFFIKNKYLIIRSDSNAVVMVIRSGKTEQARAFMEQVLKAAEVAQTSQR